jgi:hypothetical protein
MRRRIVRECGTVRRLFFRAAQSGFRGDGSKSTPLLIIRSPQATVPTSWPTLLPDFPQTVRDRRWPDAERRWLRSAWTEATLQHFTVRLAEAPEGVPTLVVEDRRMPLREVARARELARGTWHRHERALTACFDLPRDTSRLDHGQLPIAAESGSKRDVLIIRFH